MRCAASLSTGAKGGRQQNHEWSHPRTLGRRLQGPKRASIWMPSSGRSPAAAGG